MTPLPPRLQAKAAAIIAAAPPLTDSQRRAVQRALGPVVAQLAREHAAQAA